MTDTEGGVRHGSNEASHTAVLVRARLNAMFISHFQADIHQRMTNSVWSVSIQEIESERRAYTAKPNFQGMKYEKSVSESDIVHPRSLPCATYTGVINSVGVLDAEQHVLCPHLAIDNHIVQTRSVA